MILQFPNRAVSSSLLVASALAMPSDTVTNSKDGRWVPTSYGSFVFSEQVTKNAESLGEEVDSSEKLLHNSLPGPDENDVPYEDISRNHYHGPLSTTINDNKKDDQKHYPASRNRESRTKILRNPTPLDAIDSPNRKLSAEASTQYSRRKAFDAYQELGILDGELVPKKKPDKREDFGDGSCDGYHPLVSPEVDFRELIWSCLYRDCPYNGPLGCWNTSEVTDMSYAFFWRESFNDSIDSWETSSVTNMQYMFWRALSFDQPIGSWDTSKVESMRDMFSHANAFNQSIESWDTSKVTNMRYMFMNANSFNTPVGNWNITAVTDMSRMFYYASSFDQPLDSWETTNVQSMNRMFAHAEAFNQRLDFLETSSVEDMSYMFHYARSFDHIVDTFKTSTVTSMKNMFSYALSFNQPISSWDTSAVKDMGHMFEGAGRFNHPVASLKTSAVESMRRMFSNAYSFDQAIDSWDTSSVTDMSRMFALAKTFNQCLSTWSDKTPKNINVTSMLFATQCPCWGDPNPTIGPWCCKDDYQQCSSSSPWRAWVSPGHLTSVVLFGLSAFFFGSFG